METLFEHFAHVVIYKDHEGHIINLMDSDPEFAHGHFIPDDIASNQTYLLITHKQTLETQIISLWNIEENMSRKSGLKMVVNNNGPSLPKHMNDIVDAMQFGRWYTYFNLNGLVKQSESMTETFLNRAL